MDSGGPYHESISYLAPNETREVSLYTQIPFDGFVGESHAIDGGHPHIFLSGTVYLQDISTSGRQRRNIKFACVSKGTDGQNEQRDTDKKSAYVVGDFVNTPESVIEEAAKRTQ